MKTLTHDRSLKPFATMSASRTDSCAGPPRRERATLETVRDPDTPCRSPLSPAPEILKEGKVQVLLGQKYCGWGSESVRLLAEIKAGRLPTSPVIDSGVDVVTVANVEAYVEAWKKLESQ